MENLAAEKTGFESFCRGIKKNISGNAGYYIFNANEEVKEYMSLIEKEINSPIFFDTFWDSIKDDLKGSKKVLQTKYEKAKAKFLEEKDTFTYDYTLVENGTKVFPLVPVFQFNGSNMIGIMIETPITNIINGRTGLESYSRNNKKKLTMKKH